MLQGIGQRLLHDPIDRELGRTGKSERFARALEAHREAGGAHPFGQGIEFGQARLRRQAVGVKRRAGRGTGLRPRSARRGEARAADACR